MTGLLASVSSLHEARLALAGGADIIDLKEPANGALGAVAPGIQRAVTHWVHGRRTVSATIGDVTMTVDDLSAAIDATARSGVDLVKAGLHGVERHHLWFDALADASRNGIDIIAVLFADQQPDLQCLDALALAGCRGVMLDTADKRAGGLRRYLDDTALGAFVRRVRSLGLLSGLAGSLRLADVPPLLALQPDYLGFRGALCSAGERTRQLSPPALATLRRTFDDYQEQYPSSSATAVHPLAPAAPLAGEAGA